MKQQHIGFIGGGNMASSLIGGLIQDGYPPQQITVSDLSQDKLNQLQSQFKINTTQDNADLCGQVSVLVLAVKPQNMHEVAGQIQPAVQANRPLVVSIAAGIREADLDRWLGGNLAIVRCMPNTPALVQTGATGLHANTAVSEAQRDVTESILRAVGLTVWVDQESDIDTVTALSGSGPAYFLLVIEALQAAAINAGLPCETAQILAQQTALGAAKIALESSDSPEVLRQRVTSPGGTTERAIGVLQAGGLSTLFEQALVAAKQRSEELSDQLGQA